MSDIRTLFVHGVGSQKAGFSDFAAKHLSAALSPLHTLYSQEVLWAPILDRVEGITEKAAKRLGSRINPIQHADIFTAADALSYSHHLPAIFDVFDEAEAKLRAPYGVNIIAHSLGCLLAAKWLCARPSLRVNRFITTGCNIELFYEGATKSFAVPWQIAVKGVWRNDFYAQDALGLPVASWAPATDLEVRKPFWSLSTVVPALSHCDYFTDRRLWRDTVSGQVC